jgi:CRP/FNR family cyclic AMP-dependent transcriptional regulator
MLEGGIGDLPLLLGQGVESVRNYGALVLASPRSIVAHLAVALGLAMMMAGALTRTMLPLRWLAVGGNLGLMLYGWLQPAPLTLLTACALLPINLYRAVEITRLARRVKRAKVDADMASMWLRPYMKMRRYRAGHVLFRRGDTANHLYMLADGHMELVDLGVPIEPGRIFGEIAIFFNDRTRTQTVRCVTACSVMEINATTVHELFFQNPPFAFHLMELLAKRLRSDIQRASEDTLSG